MGVTVIVGLVVWALTSLIALALLGYQDKRNTAAFEKFKTNFAAARRSAESIQSDMIAAELKLLRDQNEEVQKIARYLSNEYKTEISLGYHSGRALSNIVIGYLGKEREETKLERKQRDRRNAEG